MRPRFHVLHSADEDSLDNVALRRVDELRTLLAKERSDPRSLLGQGCQLLLQTFHNTGVNRYPEIFDFVQSALPSPERVLSFGCSSGEELLTLKSRFPEAQLFGTELSTEMLQRAVSLVPSARIAHSLDEFSGQFDLIFAMSVLCRWPEPHPQGPLPYSDFEDAVHGLAGRVRAGGYLVIANASYNANPVLEELSFSPAHEDLPTGFVTMRERDGSVSVEKRCVWVKN